MNVIRTNSKEATSYISRIIDIKKIDAQTENE